MESRLEPRTQAELVVSVKGSDKTGQPFSQDALASRISLSGALLSGLGRELRSGDLISVQYANRRAKFKVVWVMNSETHQLTQAAVHLCSGEHCPWKNKLGRE